MFCLNFITGGLVTLFGDGIFFREDRGGEVLEILTVISPLFLADSYELPTISGSIFSMLVYSEWS